MFSAYSHGEHSILILSFLVILLIAAVDAIVFVGIPLWLISKFIIRSKNRN
jgi:hypothetical protein